MLTLHNVDEPPQLNEVKVHEYCAVNKALSALRGAYGRMGQRGRLFGGNMVMSSMRGRVFE